MNFYGRPNYGGYYQVPLESTNKAYIAAYLKQSTAVSAATATQSSSSGGTAAASSCRTTPRCGSESRAGADHCCLSSTRVLDIRLLLGSSVKYSTCTVERGLYIVLY